MKYINTLVEGDSVRSIYLCKGKRSAETRNGKPYDNVMLQDKTGTLDGKVWEPNSVGIGDYEENDFVEVVGDIISYNNNLQMNIKQARKVEVGEYNVADYSPSTDKDVEVMYQEVLDYIAAIENEYLRKATEHFYVGNEAFAKKFKGHSAAKAVHHSFCGGLLEHTLSVLKTCEFFANQYPIINRCLLYTAALYHDIGKTRELSEFPQNDYTDAGQLVGHIVIGVEMVNEAISGIEGFPKLLADELKHCILAHHGEYEFGSPKKPALVEAVALNFADNMDSKMQILLEAFKDKPKLEWLGYNRLFESNIRRTEV
jgi:3'-5' exoribonuclease